MSEARRERFDLRDVVADVIDQIQEHRGMPDAELAAHLGLSDEQLAAFRALARAPMRGDRPER